MADAPTNGGAVLVRLEHLEEAVDDHEGRLRTASETANAIRADVQSLNWKMKLALALLGALIAAELPGLGSVVKAAFP